jgi:hypothetical protein
VSDLSKKISLDFGLTSQPLDHQDGAPMAGGIDTASGEPSLSDSFRRDPNFRKYLDDAVQGLLGEASRCDAWSSQREAPTSRLRMAVPLISTFGVISSLCRFLSLSEAHLTPSTIRCDPVWIPPFPEILAFPRWRAYVVES